MLHFVSARLALSYLLLCVLACMGVLQIQAIRHRLAGVSLWGGRGSREWGYVTGFLLIAGPFIGFYAFTPGLFVPGLAGSELVVLFATGAALALVISLTAASFVVPHPSGAVMAVGASEEVSGPQLRGWIHVPQDSKVHPAVCLVSDMGGGGRDVALVAVELGRLGIVTLTLDWVTADDREQAPRYPDVLALVPTGVEYLSRRPEVDTSRIGVIGFGLGGDLALRAAGADEQIAAVVAAYPFLTSNPLDGDLDLLRRGSLWQAVQWRRRWEAQSALVEQLDALTYMPRIPPRPHLILQPSGSPLTESSSGVEVHPLPDPQTNSSWEQEVARVIGSWCEEHL